MGAVTRARALDGHRGADRSTRLHEGRCVIHPRRLVEIRRQEPTGLVLEKRVDTHHMAPLGMIQNGLIVGWEERLIGAFPAPDPRELADAAHELVGTSRRVPSLSGPLALEPGGNNVLATAKERSEEHHLLLGVGGDGRCRKSETIRQLHPRGGGGKLLAQSLQARARPLPLELELGKPSFLISDLGEQPISYAAQL